MDLESLKRRIRLQPKQWHLLEQLEAPNLPRTIGAGGGRGSAKSGGIDRCALTFLLSEPGVTDCIVMRTYEQLRKYHIDPLLKTWPELRDYYYKTEKKLVIPHPNGQVSQLDLGYAENYDAVEEFFRSANYRRIYVDQAEQFLDIEIREIRRAARWPTGRSKLVLSFNMGGVGIQTFRKWFYTHEYEKDEQPKAYYFIKFNPWDNVEWVRTALAEDGYTEDDYYSWDSETRKTYAALRGEYTRELATDAEAYRLRDWEGSWESLEGAYFGRVFDRKQTMITWPQAQALIQDWDVTGLSTDWGKAHYCVTYWSGVTQLSPKRAKEILGWDIKAPIKAVVTYREEIVNEMTSPMVGADIVKCTPKNERDQLKRYFLSPDAFGEKDSDNTVADNIGAQLRPYGMPDPEEADNDRKGGALLMYALLYNTKMRGLADPLSAIVKKAKHAEETVWLITSDCPNLLNSLPLLMRDKGDIDDVLKTDKSLRKLEQDCYDAARYFLKSMIAPRREAPLAVRAKEYWATLPAETPDQVQKRAMAMMRFENDNKRSKRRRSNWAR